MALDAVGNGFASDTSGCGATDDAGAFDCGTTYLAAIKVGDYREENVYVI